MRPRVFPAEDRPNSTEPGFAGAASMRPRVFPAEDAQLSNQGNQGSELQ